MAGTTTILRCVVFNKHKEGFMKSTRFYSFLFSAFIILLFVTACEQTSKEEKPQQLSQEELIERGEYLVNVGGCHDCHSPKMLTKEGQMVPIDSLLLSGHPSDWPLPEYDKSLVRNWALFTHSTTAAVGPWGVSFSANITSDGTGIGSWTFEQFKNAMTKGWYKGLEGSRPIMPPMPWQGFAHLTDQDLRAIFTYLQSTKPVKNAVPAYIPPNEM